MAKRARNSAGQLVNASDADPDEHYTCYVCQRPVLYRAGKTRQYFQHRPGEGGDACVPPEPGTSPGQNASEPPQEKARISRVKTWLRRFHR